MSQVICNGRSFVYDGNGNVELDTNGATVKRFIYTAVDQVAAIQIEGGHQSQFAYGVGGRFKRIDTDGSGKTTTTLYTGSIEKVYNHDGTIQYKRTIGGVAQVTHQVTASGALGAGDYKFLHKDHLGSINAITYGDNAGGQLKGTVAQRMAFDPWGARRKFENNQWQNEGMPFGNALDTASDISIIGQFAKTNKPITNRGFTGHEMLDEVGIIHMNGRIYDASIGRFLQADPHIDGTTSVGGFNRYAYGKNNPLNGVDPTGYGFLSDLWDDIKPFVGVIIGVVVAFVCQVCGASIINAALTGAAIGAVSAGINGGNIWKGAVMGFVSGAAFSAIGQGFADCGSCAGAGKGFLNSGLKAGAFAGKVAAHAVAGGFCQFYRVVSLGMDLPLLDLRRLFLGRLVVLEKEGITFLQQIVGCALQQRQLLEGLRLN